MSEEKKRYKMIFDFSPLAIGILDTKGVILDMNERVSDWLGYEPSEVIGRHILEVPFLTPKSKVKAGKNFTARMTGKKIPPYELEFISKQGKKVIGRVHVTLVMDKQTNKKILGSIVMISDLTELKKAEKEMQGKDLAIDSSINAIAFAGMNHRVTYANASFLKMWGYKDKKEVLDKPIYDFCETGKWIPGAMKALEKYGGWIGESKARRKDGSLFDIELSVTAVRDEFGKPIYMMASFVDITGRKQIERAKTEFVSLASHQLRTPLSTISWYTEALLKSRLGAENTKHKEYLQEIYQSNKRLIDLVNALLNVSKIELGTFDIKPEPISFVKIADEVLHQFLPQVKKKGLEVKSDYDRDLSLIDADPNLIRIIFQNLISNAVKYTLPGGGIKVSIEKNKKDVLISVSDTGYGIPEEQQAQIFTKFFRADNAREKEPDGNGLGLFIVKAVVEQSGGEIWFESKKGRGSTFYVLIPLKGMKKKKGVKQLN